MLNHNANLNLLNKQISENTISKEEIEILSLKNLFCNFFNEVIDTHPNENAEYQEFDWKNNSYRILNPTYNVKGLLADFNEVQLITANEQTALNPKDIKNLIELTPEGEEILDNNVSNHFNKLKLIDALPKVDWNTEINDIQHEERAKFMMNIEQLNGALERYYHPAPHTQFGNNAYTGLAARASSKKGPGAITIYNKKRKENDKEVKSDWGYETKLDSNFFVHPQCIEEKTHKLEANYKFYPGASIRSGMITPANEVLTDDTNFYKLDYTSMVSSIARNIPWVEHKNAIQMTNLLSDLIKTNKLNNVGIIPDLGGYYDSEIQLSFRKRGSINDIYPKIGANSIIFPAFGWYFYHKAIKEPLIVTLIKNSKMPPLDFLGTNVLYPVLHAYFSLIDFGLVHEMHGQNALVEYDLNTHETKKIIIRDLETIMVKRECVATYSKFLDAKIDDENESWMKVICENNQFKYQANQWLHHWVMRVHLEPIMGIVSSRYNISTSSVLALFNSILVEVVNNLKHANNDALILETSKYYNTNYFYYMDKMIKSKVDLITEKPLKLYK